MNYARVKNSSTNITRVKRIVVTILKNSGNNNDSHNDNENASYKKLNNASHIVKMLRIRVIV